MNNVQFVCIIMTTCHFFCSLGHIQEVRLYFQVALVSGLHSMGILILCVRMEAALLAFIVSATNNSGREMRMLELGACHITSCKVVYHLWHM